MRKKQRGNGDKMRLSDFSIEICKEAVFQAIDCFPESPIYEEVEEEFLGMLDEAYKKLQPQAVLEFGSIPGKIANDSIQEGTEALYVITTVGDKISDWSTRLFAQGNYLAGMLADAIADTVLFQLDHSLKENIIQLCREKGYGVSRRLEAPSGISMEAQKTALEITKGREILGIDITEGFMYNPVKTTCQIYLLKEKSEEYHIEHNCRECPAIHCKSRKVEPVKITVLGKGENRIILCKEEESILQALNENGIFMSAVCAGRGICGKCRIRVMEGSVEPSKEDWKIFTQAELDSGLRLSCKAYPKADCAIILEADSEDSFVVVTDYEGDGAKRAVGDTDRLGIGIDIGSTTIAMQLIDRKDGYVFDTYTTINKQRAYGADVISRILASNQGKKDELQECIRKDLKEGILELLQRNGLKDKRQPVEKIAVAGNTTMIHLLMGYSCETLGVFPFTPVNIGTIETDYEALFGAPDYSVPAVILPGISTYVGGDISSGLLVCDFDCRTDVAVLIDLGTNGEMAVGNKDRILTTSTAAGPAFEGGNITCGTGSIEGAICNASMTDGKMETTTIGNKKPVGICGTGVIEITLELLKAGLIDETGLLDEDYFEEGYLLTEDCGDIRFYQKDIREIQLAKAAVRAGLETLLLRYGVTYEQVKTVYLAGGFGYKIDIKKAIGIGLLPAAFDGKIKAIGNSSLNGTVNYLTDKTAPERMKHIIENTKEINLSNDKDFNEIYMDSMYFEE